TVVWRTRSLPGNDCPAPCRGGDRPMTTPAVPSPGLPEQADARGRARAAGQADLLGELDESARFEALLAELSAAFINVPPQEVDSTIDGGLRRLVEFLDADRSSLAEFHEGRGEFRVTHSC